MTTLYEIAVDAPLPGTLTYAQPGDRDEFLAPGRVVLVPLGRRKVTGYVLGTAPAPEADGAAFTVRPIADVLTAAGMPVPGIVELHRLLRQQGHPAFAAAPTAPRSMGELITLIKQGKDI